MAYKNQQNFPKNKKSKNIDAKIITTLKVGVANNKEPSIF